MCVVQWRREVGVWCNGEVGVWCNGEVGVRGRCVV